MFGGLIDFWRPLRHLERVLCIHRPTDHRCAGVTPAIRAVTQRVNDRLALDLIADRAAVTAAGDVDHASLPQSTRLLLPLPPEIGSEIGGSTTQWPLPLRLTVA